MKKNIILLLLIPVMVLSGCSKNNSSKNDSEKSQENTAKFMGEYSYYKNGVAFKSRQDKVERFLDFDTMAKSPLCAVPNCNHTGANCLSKNMGAYNPVFYNDYVYFFSSNGGDVRETSDGREFYIDSYLKKASLDSSEIETVCKFNYCPDVWDSYVVYNNELFFIVDDRGVTSDGYGAFSWGSSGGTFFLCSINLDNYEYKNYGSIYDGDKEYESSKYTRSSNITGVYDNKMYIEHSFVKDQSLDSNSDDYWTFLNFEFDFETKTWKEAELPYTNYMNEDCYIYYDKESKNVKVIYQGKESEINPGIDSLMDFRLSQCSEFNGKVFFPGVGKWYDLSDSSEHSMGKYVEYEVIGYKDGSYIFLKGGATAKLTEEELLALDKGE